MWRTESRNIQKNHRYHWIWECECSPSTHCTTNPSLQEPGEQVNTQKLKRPSECCLKRTFMLLKSVEYIFEEIFIIFFHELWHVWGGRAFFSIFLLITARWMLDILKTGHLLWSAKHHVAFTLQRCLKSFESLSSFPFDLNILKLIEIFDDWRILQKSPCHQVSDWARGDSMVPCVGEARVDPHRKAQRLQWIESELLRSGIHWGYIYIYITYTCLYIYIYIYMYNHPRKICDS